MKEKINKILKDYTRTKKINNALRDITYKINDLIDRENETHEHLLAISFINWFKDYKFNSAKLKKEVEETLIDDVKYVEQTLTCSVSKLDFWNDINLDREDKWYGDNCYYSHPCMCQTIDDTQEPKKKPKIKYEDKVIALLDNPYNYTKTQVYNVYKYLLEIIEKDKTIGKYKDNK